MKKEITSQYKAAIKMLVDVIQKCPEKLWDNNEFENSYWRIVYHTLYYASLYLDPARFNPWIKHKEKHHLLGKVDYDNKTIIIKSSYSKNELVEYAELIYSNCESLVNNTVMNEQSGFDWMINKGELHLYNIRHIQHHTGQLIEHLHQTGIKGIKWESSSE